MTGERLTVQRKALPRRVEQLDVTTTAVELVARVRVLPELASTLTSEQFDLPISSFSANFPLGPPLPTAQIVVPVGRRYSPTDGPDEGGGEVIGESLATQLTSQHFVEVWGRFTGKDPLGRKWPDAAVLLWAGLVSSVSLVREQGAVGIQISSVHWLHSMSSGSMLTTVFFPGDYMNLMAPSVAIVSDTGSVPATVSGLAYISKRASTGGDPTGGAAPAKFDLWWTVIMPPMTGLLAPELVSDISVSAGINSEAFSKALAAYDRGGASADRACEGTAWTAFYASNGYKPLGNNTALSLLTGIDLSSSTSATPAVGNAYLTDMYQGLGSALNAPLSAGLLAVDPFTVSMDGFLDSSRLGPVTDPQSAGGGFGVSSYRFSNYREIPPVSITLPAEMVPATAAALSNSICDYVGALLGDGLAYSSPLDKLYLVAGAMMCRVVCNARTAQLVPHLAAAASTRAWRMLTRDEILSYSVAGWANYSGQVSGVALSGVAVPSQTGQVVGVNPGSFNAIFIGSPYGPLAVEPAPEWLKITLALDNSIEIGSIVEESLLTNRVFRRTGAGRLAGDVIANASNAAARLADFRTIACNYCRARWADLYFGPRAMNLTCPLRFDIAPGSVLYLDGLDLGVPGASTGENADSGPLVGTVAAVSVLIDVDAMTCETAMVLTHVHGLRDEELGLVPSRHPVFDSGLGEGGSAAEWSGAPLVRIFDDDMLPDQLVEVR